MKRLTLSLLLLAAPALGGDHRVGTTVNLPSGITAVDSPADEECLTYESTGTTGEWQSCGGAGISLTHTGETNPYVSKATGIVKVDADDDGVMDFEFDSVSGYMEFLPTFFGFMAEGSINNFEMFLDFGDATADVTYTLADQAAGSYTLSALQATQTWTGVQSFTTPSILGKYDLNDTAVDDDDCTGEQGKGWYDSTDAAWEFCNANTGAPATVAGTAGDVTTVGDCTTGDCFTGATGTLLKSNTDLIMELDDDNNGTESFQVKDGAGATIAEITEAGAADFAGAVTATSFTADDATAEPGNRAQVNDNDTAFANDPTCANSGEAGELTMLDVNEAAGDEWEICDGTSQALDITNVAGRSLTKASGIVDADAELYTRTASFTVESPTTSDDFLLFKAPSAITITAINCIVDPAGAAESVVLTVNEYDGDGDTPAGIDGATTITCANTNTADDGALSNAAVDSGDWVGIDTGAVTGTVTFFQGTITYTVND
jgi:hypothetical protein